MLEALLDPERRKKAAEDQARLKQLMGHRVARHPAQANHLYGVARERLALEQIDRLANDADQTLVAPLYEQLAEGLALQGNLEAAAEIAPEGPRKENYAAKVKAIAHIGESLCVCAGKVDGAQLPAGRVWTGKVTIQFTRCQWCGAISAYA